MSNTTMRRPIRAKKAGGRNAVLASKARGKAMPAAQRGRRSEKRAAEIAVGKLLAAGSVRPMIPSAEIAATEMIVAVLMTPRDISCPTCGAAPGDVCLSASGGRIGKPHVARIKKSGTGGMLV